MKITPPKITSIKDLSGYFQALLQDGSAPSLSREALMSAVQILEEAEGKFSRSGQRIGHMTDKLARTEEKYRHMLGMLTRLIDEHHASVPPDRRPDDGLSVSVKLFKDALQRNDSHETLVDRAFTRLKDAVMTETRHNTREIDRIRLMGLMGRWLKLPHKIKNPEEQYMDLFLLCKESSLALLNELLQELGSVYKKETDRVEARIRKAQTIQDFTRVQEQIKGLLQEYIARSANDRVQVVCFAEKINEKLQQMDKHLVGCLNEFEDLKQKNRHFNEEMESGLRELKSSLAISTPIRELTQVIDRKTEAMSVALRAKRERDVQAEERFRTQVASLKAGLKQVRQELSEAKEVNRTLRRELDTDHLTGAASLRMYEASAVREMQRFQRYRRTFSLMVFDVDRFKSINDTYGHTVGDKCLKELIARIKPALRTTDILARTGGDEFVVILPETGGEEVEKVAEKIRQMVSRTEFIYRKEILRISISIGTAHSLPTDPDFESIFERADQALYLAKSAGRNKVAAVPV